MVLYHAGFIYTKNVYLSCERVMLLARNLTKKDRIGSKFFSLRVATILEAIPGRSFQDFSWVCVEKSVLATPLSNDKSRSGCKCVHIDSAFLPPCYLKMSQIKRFSCKAFGKLIKLMKSISALWFRLPHNLDNSISRGKWFIFIINNLRTIFSI